MVINKFHGGFMKINFKALMMASLFITSPPLALAIEQTDVKNKDQTWHKVSDQHVVMYINEPHFYTLEILVKKKHPYYKGWTQQEQEDSNSETSKIYNFIKNMKGTITVYNSDKKQNIIARKFPFQLNMKVFFNTSYFTENRGEWEGIYFDVGDIKQPGNYIITSELYAESHEYNEVMIGLIGTYGTK